VPSSCFFLNLKNYPKHPKNTTKTFKTLQKYISYFLLSVLAACVARSRSPWHHTADIEKMDIIISKLNYIIQLLEEYQVW